MGKLILDVDTGEDDALAIILSHVIQLDIAAVVTSRGNTTIENATRNTCGVLNLLGSHIPLFAGSSHSLKKRIYENLIDDNFLGKDGLCGMGFGDYCYHNYQGSHRENYLKFIEDLMEPVDYIITGPCTNLAKLHDYFGEKLHKKISKVFIMGGAIKVPGNSGPYIEDDGKLIQKAEFNFYCDPEAIQIIIGIGLPIYVIPRDVTHSLSLYQEDIYSLKSSNEISLFILGLMKSFMSNYGLEYQRSFEFNDPFVVFVYKHFEKFAFSKIKILIDCHSNIAGTVILEGNGTEVFILKKDDFGNNHIESMLGSFGLSFTG